MINALTLKPRITVAEILEKVNQQNEAIKASVNAAFEAGRANEREKLPGIIWQAIEALVNSECPYCGAGHINEISDHDIEAFLERIEQKEKEKEGNNANDTRH